MTQSWVLGIDHTLHTGHKFHETHMWPFVILTGEGSNPNAPIAICALSKIGVHHPKAHIL